MSQTVAGITRPNEVSKKTSPAFSASGAEEICIESGDAIKSVADDINFLSPRLVSINRYNLAIAEEYRKLKTQVIQMTREQGFPVSIMVASCISGEGKSVTALNLAMSLAQEIDHKVLLIDADIRNPSICRYLGLERLPGLVDCLEDGLDLEDAIVDTGLGNLCLLPAGRSCEHPVELLSSQKMKNFFNRIKREFSNNFIVIDISPVLPFAESRIMGDLVENILFVVKEGGCSLHNVMEAVEIMRNTNVLGIVFNKATAASLSGGYQYYYYDYASINRYAPPTGKKSWKERLTEFFNK